MQSATILVVEDEAIVAMDIAAQLQEIGYQVCATVDNGEAAIAMVREHRPDLVLMDVSIKGDQDGIVTATYLSKQYHTPIIFLTANNDAGTIERAASASPYGYLTKPFQQVGLEATIEIALYKANVDKRLRESESWFSSMLRCVADGVIATDPHGMVQFMNPAAEAMLEWQLDEVRGQEVSTIVNIKDRLTGQIVECPSQQALREKHTVDVKYGTLLVSRYGKEVPLHKMAAPILDDHGDLLGAVMVFRDVRERMETEARLVQMANFDPLTGLANRAKLGEEIISQILMARRLGTQIAVVYVDLDHFKAVNDSMGHAAGDDLLQQVAARLRTAVRETDVVARLGGDEFVLLLSNIHEHDNVQRVIDKIREAFVLPLTIAGAPMSVEFSMGISMYPEHGETPKELFRCADVALYQTKAEGRNGYTFYRSGLEK